jgi:hypothetical protein
VTGVLVVLAEFVRSPVASMRTVRVTGLFGVTVMSV